MMSASSSSRTVCKSLLELLREEDLDLDAIQEKVETDPIETCMIDAETGWSPLHFAVSLRRADKAVSNKLATIKKLASLWPAAMYLRCKKYGFTPLDLVCRSADDSAGSLEQDAKVVVILFHVLKHSGNDAFRDSFHDALMLHIVSMSTLQNDPTRTKTTTASTTTTDSSTQTTTPSTAVLHALVRRSTRHQLEAALEKLFACNTWTVMQHVEQEEIHARKNIQTFGLHTRPSAAFQQFWVWEWALVILRGIHDQLSLAPERQHHVPFHALHVASQIVDCPPALMMLAMRAFPNEIRVGDRNNENLPLHHVGNWKLPQGASLCRKSINFTSLAMDYPAALETRNKQDQVPQQVLALSGSPVPSWDMTLTTEE